MFSDVKIMKHQNGNPHLKAFVKVTAAGAIVLTGIRIIEGRNGMFVAMPQRVIEEEGKVKYRSIFYPLNEAVRNELEKVILAEYNKVA